MSSLHVIVREHATPALVGELPAPGSSFDLVVGGVNLTAKVANATGPSFLAELSHSLFRLASGRSTRETISLYSDDRAWELGLELDGTQVLLTLFHGGHSPEISMYQHPVPIVELCQATRQALIAALAGATDELRPSLSTALERLARPGPCYVPPAAPRDLVEIAPGLVDGFGFRASVELRLSPVSPGSDGDNVERADLHSLLVKGELVLETPARSLVIGSTPLFLIAERLLMLAEDVLDAWHSTRALFRRAAVDGLKVGVQRGPGDAPLSLVMSGRALRSEEPRLTVPELGPLCFVAATVAFAEELARELLAHDARQAKNLRLTALSRAAAALGEKLADSHHLDSLTNPEPDDYRAYGLPRRELESRGRWSHGGKMRFLPRWVATVPNIDLRATFLCGDRLIVGSTRETACLDRATGHMLWRLPSQREPSVPTPLGLVRLSADGTLRLHDLENGDARFTTRLTPRNGGGASGALVHAPGLPRLLIVAEGDRCLTAVDLVSGDVRWRHTARRPAIFRMRRAGKLLLVAGGDSSLLALDVSTGNLVWRVRDRLRFSGDISLDRDSAFAVAGGPVGPARLYHLDLWSGSVAWVAELDERPAPGTHPLLTPESVVVVVKDRRGVGAQAFLRSNGTSLWEHQPGLASPTTAWLSIDDSIMANSAAGTLLCLDARSGQSRYHHVFSRHVDADQPRRLEPVLRNGALFVPQHQVHVVRPGDGELIGTVPSDLIPDLLRVDERCDVYLAEESGHLAAFAAAPRLTLVR
jgi:outer membrane protein assembly factor BamB